MRLVQAQLKMDSTVDTSRQVATVAHLLGQPVAALERLQGGANSRVYRVVCELAPAKYVAKFYPEIDVDHRDRLITEFTGLEFMRAEGLHCIPEPVAIDKFHRCAVYGWIEGEKILGDQLTGADLDQAVEFLLALKDLGRKPGAKRIANAAEAHFSVDDVSANIDERYKRLSDLEGEIGSPHAALNTFLNDEWYPSFQKITQWCESECRRARISTSSQIRSQERVLSPSDFGFHNALKQQDGQIVFLDFEYFGWDDPAKMISDFLLHPGMDLSENHRHRFATGILSGFEDHPALKERLEIVYPLFGLKWCLIMLNRFLPQYLLDRGIDPDGPNGQSESQSQQLSKARRMLQRITGEYENFPYRN